MSFRLSITGAAALMGCPFLYWSRRQFDVKEPADERTSLDIGGALHVFAKYKRWQARPDLANGALVTNAYDAMRNFLVECQQDDVVTAKCNALAKSYESVDVMYHPDEVIYPDDLVAVEPDRLIEGMIGNVPIHGRLDAILKNGLGKLYIVEMKTTGTLHKSDSRDFNNPYWRQFPDAQCAMYVMLARQNYENVSNEILLDIIVKPGLRQAQSDNDTWGKFSSLKFEIRYRHELTTNISNYFIRHRVQVPERLIEGVSTMLNEVWIKHVLSLPEDWENKEQCKDMLRNWTKCYDYYRNSLCPLRPNCFGGTKISQLFKRVEKVVEQEVNENE